MRLLVTGACGFVGSTLIEGLTSHQPGLDVIGIDNFIREGSRGNVARLEALGVRVVEGDIRNPHDLDSVGGVDWVLDCAAEPSVLAGVRGAVTSFDVMDHNLVGTIRILEYCRKYGAGLVLISTSRVYSIVPLSSMGVEAVHGAYRPTPVGLAGVSGIGTEGITEQFPTVPPLSLYGVSKRCAELVSLEYADAFGFPLWINRCGVLAGAGQFGKADQGIFSFWIRQWRERQPLAYIGFDGAGSQVRDCLHPRDLVPLLLRQFAGRSIDRPGSTAGHEAVDSRVCNFGGGLRNSCSLANLSEWCRHRFGSHAVGSLPEPRPYDLPWVVLDSGRAKELWGWEPVTTLEDVFEEIARS